MILSLQRRRMPRARLSSETRGASVLLGLFMLLGATSQCIGSLTADEDPVASEVQRIKKLYSFEKWAGYEKVPTKEVRRLPAQERFLTQYARVDSHAPIALRSPSVTLSIFPDRADRTQIAAGTWVCASAADAKERMADALASTAAPQPVYALARNGGPYDIGDVCFRSRRSPPRRVFFVRNNAFVSVLAHRRGNSHVPQIAKQIDEILVDHLDEMDATLSIVPSKLSNFLPLVVPNTWNQAMVHARFPENTDALPLAQYPGVAKTFYWSAGRFLKPRLLPRAAFTKSHLLLIPAGNGAPGGVRQDIAFLRYRAGASDILISQTGGYGGRLYLFVMWPAGRAKNETMDMALAESLLESHLTVGRLRPFDLDVESSGDLLLFKGVDKRHRKSERFVGLVSKRRFCLVIEKNQLNDPMPAAARPADAWFRRVKNAWPGIPLESFGTYDRSLLRRPSSARAGPVAPEELTRAIQERNVAVLRTFASGKSEAQSRKACEALAKTPEGRSALVDLMAGKESRHAGIMMTALVRAGVSDVLPELRALAQDGGRKSGNYLLSIEKDVEPFVLVRQGKQLWPSDRRSEGPQEQYWGAGQTWARPHDKDSVWIVACSFAEEAQGLAAARKYSVSMAAAFREGAIGGESFGDKCWHSGNNAIVFARGRFAFAVGVPGIRQAEKVATLALFARALDNKARKAVESGGKPDLIPAQDVAGRAIPARVPRQLSQAIAANNIEALARYVVSSRSDESDPAIAALAKSGEGREALFDILSEQKTDKSRAGLILAALGNSEAPDAIHNLRRFAQTTDDPRLYGEAIEAIAEAMPAHEARQFCIEEVEKLSDHPDAAVEKLIFLLQGLRQDEDPTQVKLLRKILNTTKNEKLRVRCLRMLSNWVRDGDDAREDVLRLLKNHLTDENPRARGWAVRGFGRSGDVRQLSLLAPLLDDKDSDVRVAAAEAVCRLLGWERPRLDNDEQEAEYVAKLKPRLVPILKALGNLAAASKPN